jgi:hypothetical protein
MFLKIVAQEKIQFIQACFYFGGSGARKIFRILYRLISEEILPSPQILSDLFTLNSFLNSDEKTEFFFALYKIRCGTLRKFFSLIYTESKLIKTQVVQILNKMKSIDWLNEDLYALGAHFEILMHKVEKMTIKNDNKL